MIDIHSHILYDCDDGSKSFDESIDMIKCAQKNGVTDIFLTPHYMEDGYKSDKSIIYKKMDLLKKKIEEQGIDLKLYSGEEIFIFPTLAEEIDDKIISLNSTKYVLVELPLIEEINYIEDVIYNLLSKGCVPIIAHPERYLIAEKNFMFIAELINRGALMQINVNSLLGRYGKNAEKIAKKMLKQNMVHFVASDAHSINGYNMLSESLKCLRKLVDEKVFNEITYINQQKVINNEDIIIEKIDFKSKRNFFLNIFKKEG